MEDLSSCGMMNTKETIPLSGTDFLDYSIEDDACSICLEPFSCSDPSTVTGCKHEYHLQCILEWSQRSKECPICWRALVLKDPASQELLEAVEIERNSRSRQRSSTSSMFAQTSPEHYDFEPIPYSVESELDEHIMEHLRTAVLGRARHFGRRQRHSRSPGLDQFLAFSEPSDDSDLQETPAGSQSSGNPSSPESDSERNIHSAAIHNQPTPHILTSYNTDPNVTDIQQNSSRPRGMESQTSPESPRRSRPSEVLSFSETLKSKFAAASARYKESITKSTRGLKEKLLARNNSVKELSKEVQREVTASIAGVARMMERLDPNIKNSGGSSPISTDEVGTSNLSHNGKGVQGSQITPSPNGIHLETSHGTSSHSPIPGPGGLSSV